MSSIRRKPGTQFWFICFTDADGIQRQKSSKTTDRRQAERMAWSLEEAYRRKLTESQMRRMLSEAHEEIHGKPLNDVPLGKFLDRWLARIKAAVSPGTFARYSTPVNVLKSLKPELAKKLVEQVETRDLLELRDEMLKTRGSSTVNTNLKVLRQAFRAAWQEGLIADNPCARVPPARRTALEQAGGRRPFTLGELKLLLATADEEWRGLILTSLYTGGQRLGDVARLTVGNVDMVHRVVKFRAAKTGRWTPTPIPPPLIATLKGMIPKDSKPSAPLFPAIASLLRGEEGGDVARLSARFGRLLYRAGLAANPSTAKAKVAGRRTASPLSFHSLRHTATSMLKNAGVSDSVVMDIVGHESEAVSANYTHIDDETKRAALSKLPDIT